MKTKTSISLSSGLLKIIDNDKEFNGNRSLYIEEAVKWFQNKRKRDSLNRRDFDIINKNAVKLNKEADDVLEFQGEL